MYFRFDPRTNGETNGRPRPQSAPSDAASAWWEEPGATLEDDFAQQVAEADDLQDVELALIQAAEVLTGVGSARWAPLSKRGLEPGFEAATIASRHGARVWGWLVLDESMERLADRRDSVFRRLETLGVMAGRALDRIETRDLANPPRAISDPSRPASAPDRVANPWSAISGIHDETFLNAVLPLFFNQAKRHGEPLSILYVAIDRLEAIRSLLGAELADQAAHGVGRAIASRIRSSDFAARLADGRFVIVLPRADILGALIVARDLHQIVSETASTLSEIPDLTISSGAAAYPSRASSLAELHEAAESALAAARGPRIDRAAPAIPAPSSPRSALHPAACEV